MFAFSMRFHVKSVMGRSERRKGFLSGRSLDRDFLDECRLSRRAASTSQTRDTLECHGFRTQDHLSPFSINLSRSVIKPHCFAPLGDASCRTKFPGLLAQRAVLWVLKHLVSQGIVSA